MIPWQQPGSITTAGLLCSEISPFTARQLAMAAILQDAAERTITEGQADLIAFGQPFISSSVLVEWFKQGWPRAAEAPLADWYLPRNQGHADFPAHQ